MAKQIFTINQFHGGISEVADPRDIEDNEMSVLEGINVSHLGKIITLGDLVDHEANNGPGHQESSNSKVISPGYGFFFKSDWNKIEEIGGNHYWLDEPDNEPENIPENYLALVNGRTGIIRLYAASSEWQSPANDGNAWRLTTGGYITFLPDVVYVRGSGNFRASDANFNNITGDTLNTGVDDNGELLAGSRNQVGWLGHIQKKRWTGLTTDSGNYKTHEININMWKATHSEIKSPEQLGVMGRLELEEESDVFPNEDATNLGNGNNSAEGDFYLSMSANKTESGGWRGFKQYYMSFIYDGIQESMISPFLASSGVGTIKVDEVWEDSKKSFRLRHRIKDSYIVGGNYPLNERITGGRIYFKETNSLLQAYGDAILLFEFDLDKGSKKFLDTKWSEWEYDLNANVSGIHAVRTPAGGGASSPTIGGASYAASGNNVITHASTDIFEVGNIITSDAAGIPTDAYVFFVTDATHFVLSINTTSSQSGATLTSHKRSDGMMVFNTEPTGPTHEALSGISSNETSIYACYKTAVIANNRLYAANIGQVDPNVTRNKNAYTFSGDAMLKSPVLKYDVLPSLSKIEVTIGDGDEITCLETYADRLLQFKSQKLHIINISQDFEFLEQTLNFKGVENPGAVCKTDFGIAWLNEYGCFLYDGEKVTDLLEKKARKLINKDTWSSFIGAHPTIGFDPKTKDLICKGDNEINSTGQIYLYNLIIQGWVTDPNAFIDLHNTSGSLGNNAASNMLPDYNGDLCIAGEDKIYYWDASASDKSINIYTKDFDFGLPGVKKKVYKVYVTYKGTEAGDVTIKYLANGDIFAGVSNPTGNGYSFNNDDTPLTSQADETKWHIAELSPTSPGAANGIYSFRLQFYGTTIDKSFEINDISIVYRVKNIK